MKSAGNIKKAFGMPSADAAHTYIFRSGEYGTFYQYWWRDRLGNYYRYSNAAEDSEDFDPFYGPPLLDQDQPFQEKNPEFFTDEGYKRNHAIAEGKNIERNPLYSQSDGRRIWFEMYEDEGPKFVYLDADVKENLDLYVQQQVRIVDANLASFRKKSSELFAANNVKDKITAAILLLCDQAFFEPEELVNATVGDISFVDQTVVLLGRKFVCDITFLDFITSISAQRAPTEPLFMYETMHGRTRVGINYINAVFYSMKVSPKFLLYWNASHLYSRIVNRMAFQQVPEDEVAAKAMEELSRTLNTRDDVAYLVDFKVKAALLRNYEVREQEDLGIMETSKKPGASPGITKSLSRLLVDDFGIAVVRSDLTKLRQDESEFSVWLQNEPMHDMSPEQEEMLEEAVREAASEEEQPEKPESDKEETPPASPEDAESTPPEEAPE